MKIDIDRDDVLQEIVDNHYGDVELFANIAINATSTYDELKEVAQRIISEMVSADVITASELGAWIKGEAKTEE